jgi:beta-1,4-mannosyl-glycoprotein beta-1,4-N-acetylglucosaminyltransferase
MIIDCFTFFNELDLLEIRLHTLAPWVDAFVLVEANRTFQGAKKPLYFKEHQKDPRFSTGRPIVAVTVDLSSMDSLGAALPESAWIREEIQRRSLIEVFRFPETWSLRLPSDRIILSDVDEIPDLSAFSQVDPDCPTIISWNQTLFYYWVNMKCWKWTGPVSCTWETFQGMFDSDFQLLRNARGKAELMIQGGWHFSFLGGPAAIKQKIEAFSHTEYRHAAEDGNIEWALEEGWRRNKDLFGRTLDGMRFELMPDDTHLPAYLVANKDRFRDWWYAE